ncbi:hypothetical protein BDFB_014488 [Asbolus verrucosus]|uniref:DDE 3 domain containing protein n=1 Tax=Asbolus verrucosus TaxID=1661398 RepID=A0A482VJ67_ASBVE|nr:hypothetical protein BDFB_014488 [Asbolus verrucosus]
MNNDQELLPKIIFSDKAWFHISGYVKSQNTRIWRTENPHEVIEMGLQPVKIGVWAGFSRTGIIGPIFFQGTINAQRYRMEILQSFIDQLLDDETGILFSTR